MVLITGKVTYIGIIKRDYPVIKANRGPHMSDGVFTNVNSYYEQ